MVGCVREQVRKVSTSKLVRERLKTCMSRKLDRVTKKVETEAWNNGGKSSVVTEDTVYSY